jgi:hypothetical protein
MNVGAFPLRERKFTESRDLGLSSDCESRAEKAKGDVSFRQWFPLDNFSTASRPPDPISGRHTTCVCLISDSPRAKSWVTSRLPSARARSSHSSRAAEYLFSPLLSVCWFRSMTRVGQTTSALLQLLWMNFSEDGFFSQNGCRFILVETGTRVQAVANWKRAPTTDDVTYLPDKLQKFLYYELWVSSMPFDS